MVVHINLTGAPKIPCKIVTLAVPSGAVVKDVKFYGIRQKIENAEIEPVPPFISLMNNKKIMEKSLEIYEHNRNIILLREFTPKISEDLYQKVE